jgi:hypothetical protein
MQVPAHQKSKRQVEDLNHLAMLADWQLRGHGINPTTITKERLRHDAELVDFRASVRAEKKAQEESERPGMWPALRSLGLSSVAQLPATIATRQGVP